MILSEVKDFIETNRVTSMFFLVTHFNMEPETVREMLQLLIDKGLVKRIEKESENCSKCNQCHPLMFEMYEWVEEES